MEQIYQSAILQALGWALADSIWQMALLWLVYQLCIGLPVRNNPSIRHLGATIALFAGGLWFIGNVIYKLVNTSSSFAGGQGKFDPSLVNWMESLLPYLSSAYLIVLVVLMAKFIHSIILTQRLRIPENKPALEWQDFVDIMALRFFIERKVFIRISDVINVPATIGFVKPVILLPVASVNSLSVTQVEAIIMHELAHIKRYDYLINLIASFIETLMFFNPFTHLLGSQIRKECELCCDDAVLSQKQDPGQYAYALLLLEKSRQRYPLMVAATGKESLLLGRVKRILNQPEQKVKYKHKLLALVLVAGLIMALSLITPYQKEKNELPAKQIYIAKQFSPDDGQPSLPMMMKVPLEEIRKEIIEPRSPRKSTAVHSAPRESDDMDVILPPLPPTAPMPPSAAFSTPPVPPSTPAPFIFDFSPGDAASAELWKTAEMNRVIKLNGWDDKELKALLSDVKEAKFDVEMAGKMHEVLQGTIKVKRALDTRQAFERQQKERKRVVTEKIRNENRQDNAYQEFEKAFDVMNQYESHQRYTEKEIKELDKEMNANEGNWRLFEQQKAMAEDAIRQSEKLRKFNESRTKQYFPITPEAPRSRSKTNTEASPEILYRATTESGQHVAPKVRTYKDENGMTISIIEDENQIRIHLSTK